MTEQERAQAFKDCPILAGFLSTMLQDMQQSEMDEACTEGREERDCGTIWNCPVETFQNARNVCTAFLAAPETQAYLEAAQWPNHDLLGSDLYLTVAGHGAGLWDGDRPEPHGNAMTHAVNLACPYFEAYLGDDGQVYLCGGFA